MRDKLELASVPSAEDCAPLGSADYRERARKECRAFREQLRRTFGPEPEGARLVVLGNPHEFGTYFEVACEFDETLPASVEYAFRCDSEMPEHWDAEARGQLFGTNGDKFSPSTNNDKEYSNA